MSDQFFLVCARLINRVLFVTFRYPAITSEYLNSHIKRCQADSESQRQLYAREVRELEWTSVSRCKKLTAALALALTLYSLKNLVFSYILFTLYDHQDASRSLARVAQSGNTSTSATYSFACLLTNCSRLLAGNERNLADDLSLLPVFRMCYPNFNKFLTPASQLGTLSLFIFFMSVFLLFLMAIATPLINSQYPVRDETLKFITAPNITTRLLQDEVRQLSDDLAVSRLNYVRDRARRSPRDFSGARKFGRRSHFRFFFSESGDIEDSPSASVVVPPARRLDDDDDGDNDWFVNECLPAVRSEQWRSRMTRTFCAAFVLLNWFMLAMAVVVFTHVYRRLEAGKTRHRAYEREMRLQNCHIWLAGAPAAVELAELEPRWEWQQVLETFAMHAIPALSITALLSSYFVTIGELSCWLGELCSCFVSQIALVYFEPKFRRRETRQASPMEALLGRGFASGDLISMRRIKQEALESYRLAPSQRRPWMQLVNERLKQRIGSLRARPDSDSARITIERQRCRTDADVLFMERVYINFRLFMRHVGDSSSSASLLASMIYPFNYGSVLIAVFFNSRMKNIGHEPNFLAVAGWVVSTAFIALAANFHANTRKFQTLIWSLIARLNCQKDPQLWHIRNLWLKQASVFDANQRGIALCAYKIQLTYGNIIQILVWTGTIVVIALKPQ